MSTTTLGIVNYYANLLILQYLGKPKAYATVSAQVTPIIQPQVSVQTISFALAPTTGTFVLDYLLGATAAINWNDSAATIQTKVQAVTGLASVTVTGSIAGLLLTVTMTGVTPPAQWLALGANTLQASATPVVPVILETDVTLPVAVQNAFNLLGPNPAQGVQLDVLGKYAGVTRTNAGFASQITLDDADFLTLIQIAIIKNSSGSSLATIQALLHQFFPNEILVFDNKDMTMDYIVSQSIASESLIELFVTEGVLPKPMGVLVRAIVFVPTVDLFSFRTYEAPAYNASPFNNYPSYQTDYPWLSYAEVI